jgi:hypothetical protein
MTATDTATPIPTRADDSPVGVVGPDEAAAAREREFRWRRWMDDLGGARPDED